MILCVCLECVCVSYISELQLLSIIDALHLGVSLRADVVVVGVCGHQQHVCNTGQRSSQHLTRRTPQFLPTCHQRTQKPTTSNILLFNIIFMYLLYIQCSIWLKCNNMLVSFILAKCKTYLLYCYFYSTFTNWFDVFLFVWPLKSCTEVLLYSSAIIIKNKRVNRCSRIKLFSGEMSRQFPPSH